MNDAQKHFRELLTDAPFDDAYRSEHRDEVRQRALQAFDEAAAEGAPATVSLSDSSRQGITRRSAVRMAFTAVAAASVCAALVAWYGRSDEASSSDAVALLDQELIAALSLLSDFDEGRAAATFDQGIQVCLIEHDSQSASRSRASLKATDQ